MADGHTWTNHPKVADAINRSQDGNGGMVVLNVWDSEEFECILREFVGICAEQNNGPHAQGIDGQGRVFEYSGWDDDSPRWSVQVCLCPHQY